MSVRSAHNHSVDSRRGSQGQFATRPWVLQLLAERLRTESSLFSPRRRRHPRGSSSPRSVSPTYRNLKGKRYTLPVVGEVSSVVQPPAPPLVGIEPNPGPPKSFAALMGDAAASLAVTLAKTKKKTKEKKKKSSSSRSRGRSMLDLPYGVSSVLPPTSVGTQLRRSGLRHLPMVVTGKNYACDVMYNSSGFTVFRNSAGSVSTANAFNIDPAASGSDPNNFQCFPNTIGRITRCFLRYRLNSLKIRYVPYQPTSQPGAIALAVSPECFGTGTGILPSDNVYSSEVTSQTPVWSPIQFDAMVSGGLRREWLYVDSHVSTDQANNRQESPGVFMVYANTTLPAQSSSITLGQIWFDFELEFDGLGTEVGLLDPPRPSDGSSSSSSSSSLPTPAAGSSLHPSEYLLVKVEQK